MADLVQEPATDAAGGDRRPLRSSMKRGAAPVGFEQLGQPQPGRRRGGQLPPVPEERQRSGGLEVPHLETALVGVHVALDDVGARARSPGAGRPGSCRPGGRWRARSRRPPLGGGAPRARARPRGPACRSSGERDGVADEGEGDPGDHVEDVVVGGRDDRQPPSSTGSIQPMTRTSSVPPAVTIAMPTSRSQPACRLGRAAYWFTKSGGWRYAVRARPLGDRVDERRGPPAAAARPGR